MDNTGKRTYIYFYLPWTQRAREDINTFTYHGQNGKEKIYILLLTMDTTGKSIYIYFYLPWTKRAREDIYNFTYHGQNGKEKIYILLLTMDKTGMFFLARFVHGK
jgi:uncharacterized protein YrzB (UPF0473 family)